MPSPFPGMNPYLEQEDVWQDFHNTFLPALRGTLTPQVSPHFVVKIEEHLYVQEQPEEPRIYVGKADVGIASPSEGVVEENGGVATISAPVSVVIPIADYERDLYLEIHDRRSRELITVIEVLSPSNKKPGADREQYFAKRSNFLRSEAHFVEIDLLRGWPRMPFEQAQKCDYCVLISCANDRPRAGFWPIQLRERLPRIPIPLRAPLTEASVDLQQVLNNVYDAAYYKDHIYRGMPQPPLGEADAAWAEEIVKKHLGE